MIERRIVQLKVQTRKQRDRQTHIRTHTGSCTRSHARTHARYRRTKKQSCESMPTNEQHDHFHFFVFRKLWTVLLVWASMLWLDWEDIWVSKTFFLIQLVSFFNNTLLCEKKKQRWSLNHCTRGEIPHVDVLKVIVEFPLHAVLHRKLSFFFYYFFLFFIFFLFYAEIKVSDSPSSVWPMHNFIFSVHSHSLFFIFIFFYF